MALALKVSKVETIAGNFFVEPHIITGQEAIDKKIVLQHTPTKPQEVMMDIPGGTIQRYGTDFTIINGNEVSWDGYALETLLEEDDNIRITYIL